MALPGGWALNYWQYSATGTIRDQRNDLNLSCSYPGSTPARQKAAVASRPGPERPAGRPAERRSTLLTSRLPGWTQNRSACRGLGTPGHPALPAGPSPRTTSTILWRHRAHRVEPPALPVRRAGTTGQAREAKAVLGAAFRREWAGCRPTATSGARGRTRARRRPAWRHRQRFVDRFEETPMVVLACSLRLPAPTVPLYPACQNLLLAAGAGLRRRDDDGRAGGGRSRGVTARRRVDRGDHRAGSARGTTARCSAGRSVSWSTTTAGRTGPWVTSTPTAPGSPRQILPGAALRTD